MFCIHYIVEIYHCQALNCYFAKVFIEVFIDDQEERYCAAPLDAIFRFSATSAPASIPRILFARPRSRRIAVSVGAGTRPLIRFRVAGFQSTGKHQCHQLCQKCRASKAFQQAVTSINGRIPIPTNKNRKMRDYSGYF